MPKSSFAASASNAVNSNKSNNYSNVENQDTTSSGNAAASTHTHSLSKYQGQKWQQIFDVEKVLKQIRMAEKIHIKGKGGGSSGSDGSHKSSNSSNNFPPNKSRKNAVRQVQRLNGTDMHYYGIVPKQTALDVVVCSVCMGIYTKVGFNNHMMVQHPSVWTNVSTKVSTQANDSTLGANDNSQDSVKGGEATQNIAEVSAQSDVMGSPSDFSGTMSACSNASSSSTCTVSSAAPAISYVAPSSSRQKSSSKAGSSSGNSNSSRSRSKSKHHSSSFSVTTSASSNANAEMSHSSATAGAGSTASSSTKKSSSKKSSSSSSSSNANSSSTATTTSSGSGNANNIVTSSNTQLILNETESKVLAGGTAMSSTTAANATLMTSPSTTAMLSSATDITSNSVSSVLDASQNNLTTTTTNLFGSSSSSSSSSFSSSSSSSSSSSNSSYSLPPTPKMVANNSLQDSQQVNVKTETFSPTACESKDKLNSTTNREIMTSSKKKIKSPVASFCIPDNVEALKPEALEMPPLRMVTQQPLNHYEGQISELDQAVSSITVGSSNGHENKLDITTVVNANNTSTMGVKTGQLECAILSGTQQNVQQQQQHQLHTEDGQLVHNTSDDSAMLNHVLDVMLDSKLINEILNAETELNFDENVLNESSSTAQHNSNQQHQQQSVYLEEPLTKRMRFDESTNMGRLQQQLSAGNHEISGEFTVFPQQQQLQSQQQQSQQSQAQYAQYDNSEMGGTLGIDGQYQAPIDAMQLQQLLYQQQQQQQQTMDATAYVGGNIDLQHQQQHQQIYDPNGTSMVDTKHILELCGGNVGVQANSNEMLKAEEFVTLPEDVSDQFQIFNVPSLTDDIEPEMHPHQQQVTHHIVERQFIMPGHEETEEQLIYEITTNNSSMTPMSQQHQQQVLAEFLNQAASTYEQQQNQQLQQQNFVGDNTNKTDNPYDELLDFDFSLIETVKSLNSSSSSISSGNTNAIVKSERDNSINSSSSSSPSTFKYHDDFYFNVFFYAGIPRPLAINCFGLIKLPQGVATTFRKHLLTTRKANNSLMSLVGGPLNGVVGQSSSTTASGTVSSRFSNSKQLPSYFTNLANSGSGNNLSMGSEFSIGSITITNAPSNVPQQGCNNSSLQQSSKQNSSIGLTNPLEINLSNINGGISATSPVSNTPRGRTKSGGSNHSTGSYNSSSNTLKHKSTGALVNSSNAARVTVGTIGPYNAKTIFVSSAAAQNSERNKFVKRSLIAKIHPDTTRASQSSQSQQQFTSKKLSDLLNGKRSYISANNSDVNTLSSGQETNSEIAAENQAKINRMNRFYEKRRNLLSITQQHQNQKQTPFQRSQALRRQQLEQLMQPQQQQQKFLKQQLMRNFSDCGINSTSNNNVTSADSNVMRVFV